MCQYCGCTEFVKAGMAAVTKRAAEIVQELRLKPENVDDYECTEAISAMIVPFTSRQDDVFQAASWISGLHEGVSQSGREKQYQAYVHAFQDIFARLPTRGEPKHIGTTYHQLEQLARELDEASLTSLPSEIQAAIQAVNHVHEDQTRQMRLKQRYGL